MMTDVMIDKLSVIIVNYNGFRYLGPCLQSLRDMNSGNFKVTVILIDNGSTDASLEFVQSSFPEVSIICNDCNNFSRALNIGVKNANSEIVAFLNNDMTVEKNWLTAAISRLLADESIGAVQSKIRFMDNGRINSAGVEEVEDFYFRDIGFDEKDTGQYDKPRELKYFSGGAVMLRKNCFDAVGDFDEDFIMYCEDVDYSIRCRQKGWKIWYEPVSVVNHKYQGSASSALCEYLCSRNRLFCIAKHFPEKLPSRIRSSHLFLKNDKQNLYRVLLQTAKKLVISNNSLISCAILDQLKNLIKDRFGPAKAISFFSCLELMLDLRKIRVGIYDHAFHFAGGGQRYVATIAEMLQYDYDITYVANKDVQLEKYREWFNLDLSGCRIEVKKLPFFECRNRYFIDEGMVVNEAVNPFDIISRQSLNYDVFINANMLGKVHPLSPVSVFICHFPDRDKEPFFQVDNYDYLISNGNYTSHWIKKRWGLTPTHRIYPPVDMYNPEARYTDKGKMILSVARFEVAGSKKQLELLNAFQELKEKAPDIMTGWRLVLVGGNFPDNPYFHKISQSIRSEDVLLQPDLTHDQLKQWYVKSSIFWHACGLYESEPHKIEHFGMTTVEAMQNKCVPVVYDGGGQKEIVSQGKDGYRFQDIGQLQNFTLDLIKNEGKRKQMAYAGYMRSHDFNLQAFQKHILAFFSEIERDLRGVDAL